MSVNSVDIVIPCYNENPDRIVATVESCLDQTHPVQNVFIVDDGSEPPTVLPDDTESERVEVIRLSENMGQPAARNKGILKSNADYVACVDVEVLLADNWVETCLNYLQRNPEVGACCARIKTRNKPNTSTRWRYRFLEPPYERENGSYEVNSCTGHAVLFRSEALSKVDGYDPDYINHYEDADICRRLRMKGYSSHVVEGTFIEYIQDDELSLLAKKILRNNGWALKPKYAKNPTLQPINFTRLAADQTYWLFHRMARNLFKLRLSFIPVDILVWAYALRIGWEARKEFE